MAHMRLTLPDKTCVVRGQPFRWRKRVGQGLGASELLQREEELVANVVFEERGSGDDFGLNCTGV